MSVLGVIGAVIGAFYGGPAGASLGYSIGSGVDAYTNQPDRVGPRLEDLRTQMSTYGAPIPFEWGCNRHAGTIIWPKTLDAVEHEHSESAKGGGPESINYTYTLSLAVLVCEGPIAGIRRIWANKKIIYDVSAPPVEDVSIWARAISAPVVGSIRFYLGTEDQDADPLIEAADGPSPAYRGYAYVVFENYDVTEMQGRPPQFEFEVTESGAADFSPELTLLDLIPAGAQGLTHYHGAYDTDRGNLWIHNGTHDSDSGDTGGASDHSCINVYHLATRERLAIISPGQDRDYGDLVYDPDRQKVFAGGEYTDSFGNFDANGANMFDPETFTIGDQVLRTEHTEGVSWPARPGILVRIGTLDYLAASSSSHLSSGVCLWSPAFGAFASTGDIEGWWKTQAIYCSNGRVAMITDFINGGLLLVVPDPSFYPTFYPKSNFGGLVPTHICEIPSQDILIVCSGTKAYALNMETGDIADFYEDADGAATSCSIYDVRSNRIYLVSSSPSSNTIRSIDADTLEVINDFSLAAMDDRVVEMFISPIYGEIVLKGEVSIWLLSGMYNTLSPNQVVLSTIVSDICLRAGLMTGDIDVAQLTDLVDGYIVPRQMTARSAIEPLQAAFFFDAVESDDRIIFVKRDGGSVTTIPQDERAAHENNTELPDALSITRAFELELPYQCEVEYPDIDADQQVGTQYERRLTKESRQKLTIQLPIVMTDAAAKRIARIALYESWLNMSFAWTTSRKYAYLRPTDLVSLPTAAATYQARITAKREQPNGVIEWEGVIVDMEVFDQTGEGAAPTDYVSQTVYTPSETMLELMDAPILRDQDAGKGFYVAMAGETTSWKGAQLYRSADGGSSYDSVLSQGTAATIGVATSILGDFTGGNVFDDGNSVTVHMRSGATLLSYTREQVLSGAGVFALGVSGRWEIVQYSTATLIAADTYTLTGLLRGLRGTEWAISTHQAADHFIFANPANWRLFDPGPTDIEVERKYKAPSTGMSIASAVVTNFTDEIVRLRPYSVANLVANQVADGYRISWAHRSIVGGEWRNGVDVALDAAFMSFSVSILDAYGTAIKNYVATSESMDYPLLQLTADFGYYPSVYKVRVAQKNSNFGDGVGVTITTDGSAPPVFDTTHPVVPVALPSPTPGQTGDYRILVPREPPTADSQFGPWKVLQCKKWPVEHPGAIAYNDKIECFFGAYSNDRGEDERIGALVETLDPITGTWELNTDATFSDPHFLERPRGVTFQDDHVQVALGNSIWMWLPEGTPQFPAFDWDMSSEFGLAPGTESVFPVGTFGGFSTVGTASYFLPFGLKLEYSDYTRLEVDTPPSNMIYGTDAPFYFPYKILSQPTSAAVGTKTYLLGAGDVTWIYDTETDSYSAGAPHPLDYLQAAETAVVGTVIYVFGGVQQSNSLSDRYAVPSFRVFAYDTVADTWSEKTSIPSVTHFLFFPGVVMISDHHENDDPRGRSGYVATEYGGKIYLTGGKALEHGQVNMTLDLPANNLLEYYSIPDIDIDQQSVGTAWWSLYKGMTFEYDPALDIFPPDHVVTSPDFGGAKIWDGTNFIAASVEENLLGVKEVPGVLWISTDGLNYTALSDTDCPLRPDLLFYSSGVYLMHEQTPGHSATYRSTNLTDWTLVDAPLMAMVPFPAYDGIPTADVIVQFLDAGSEWLALYAFGDIATSSDLGITWTHRCNVPSGGISTGTGHMMHGIAYGASRYVVAATINNGNSGYLYRASTLDQAYGVFNFGLNNGYADDISGIPIYNKEFIAVAFYSGYFYVVGYHEVEYVDGEVGELERAGFIMRSDDGIDWVDVSPYPTLARSATSAEAVVRAPSIQSSFNRIFEMDNGDLIALGTHANAISTDGGATWTEQAHTTTLIGGATDGDTISLMALANTYNSTTNTYTHTYQANTYDGATYSHL